MANCVSRRLARCAGLHLAALVAVGDVATAQALRDDPLPIEAVLGLREFADRTPIDLSPDGRWVAFTLVDPRLRAEGGAGNPAFDATGVPRSARGGRVHVANARDGTVRRIADDGSAWGPVWSPDGRTLAFYWNTGGAVRIWGWDPSRDEVRLLTDVVVRPYWGFESIGWFPDGHRLLLKTLPARRGVESIDRLYPPDSGDERQRVAAGPKQVFEYRPGARAAPEAPASGHVDLDTAPSILNLQLGDLTVVDLRDGRRTQLAGWARLMAARLSPDGRNVAFTTRQPAGDGNELVYDRYDLWVVPTAGGEVRAIDRGITQTYGQGLSWSPDSRALAYVDGRHVRIVEGGSGAAVDAFEPDTGSFAHDYRAPLWIDANRLAVTAGGTLWTLTVGDSRIDAITIAERSILGLVAHGTAQHLPGTDALVVTGDARTKSRGVQRVNLATGRATALYEADVAVGLTGLIYQLDRSADGGTIAFVAQSAGSPPEIWIADSAFERPIALTSLNPEITTVRRGQSRLVEWLDADGRPRQGALLLPAGYEPGRRYPLVVKVYGGSNLSGNVHRFGLEAGVDNLQLLATRGYAVLTPDAPTRVGTPLADIADAVERGARAVVTLGIADPARLAVFGHSYGGYSALAVATTSSAFKAVISRAGFASLLDRYTELREDGSTVGIAHAEDGQGRMGGHPWAFPDRYRDNSPMYFLDRVRAPVLLLHGGADRTVVPEHSDAVFVALRRLEKAVRLVRYPGEDHHPAGWTMANAVDQWNEIFDWLQRHLAAPGS